MSSGLSHKSSSREVCPKTGAKSRTLLVPSSCSRSKYIAEWRGTPPPDITEKEYKTDKAGEKQECKLLKTVSAVLQQTRTHRLISMHFSTLPPESAEARAPRNMQVVHTHSIAEEQNHPAQKKAASGHGLKAKSS